MARYLVKYRENCTFTFRRLYMKLKPYFIDLLTDAINVFRFVSDFILTLMC